MNVAKRWENVRTIRVSLSGGDAMLAGSLSAYVTVGRREEQLVGWLYLHYPLFFLFVEREKGGITRSLRRYFKNFSIFYQHHHHIVIISGLEFGCGSPGYFLKDAWKTTSYFCRVKWEWKLDEMMMMMVLLLIQRDDPCRCVWKVFMHVYIIFWWYLIHGKTYFCYKKILNCSLHGWVPYDVVL